MLRLYENSTERSSDPWLLQAGNCAEKGGIPATIIG